MQSTCHTTPCQCQRKLLPHLAVTLSAKLNITRQGSNAVLPAVHQATSESMSIYWVTASNHSMWLTNLVYWIGACSVFCKTHLSPAALRPFNCLKGTHSERCFLVQYSTSHSYIICSCALSARSLY
jgi:hypothetical protein